ncbi:neuraminidase [Influenza A virus (A/sanderling/Delaware Bay/507/2016(H10N5))]|uniref:Neuraminidase n=76 Tax=Influenza A virus TaxID=11320 RepID=A0A248T811_9INFA|nr:neuraminidase [Influenza A virus (A/gull/Delaware Bay/218/2016(H10N5))]ASJ81591.2 neuraminidase [Influenza A virus (A/ruddy turnstone/Delaware Bay/130/2016(H10N5))]ASJ81704.2 neuraminidase [Influenza A virus (A/ruddy turnstone/Delaware Bay/468/2016(H10N5))]ASJ81730.2 neuraminidase [Influenza A virus (A/ruddy turnstone/Delaware Bay/309/2016(H10N5))]ASJ81764.2 neuraminidase [Influenza A virus (A/herring gull/Delaware Bay/256/2016(H10N5))]ASJ81860.1 neuraminidase [Influenza A virus (A/ruddy tu
MNPNQKIITIGSVSLALVVFNILLHIASIVIGIISVTKEISVSSTCNTTEVYNETVRLETITIPINNTVYIERESHQEPEFLNNTEPLCNVSGFAIVSKDNGIRIGSRGHVFVIREPFVACGPTECRTFFLTQGALLNDKHSNNTVKDRSPYRALMSVPLGSSPNAYQAKFESVAWSATACHDGKRWLAVGISGADDDAYAVIHYGGMPTDVVRSWRKQILRTQESSCVCMKGNCYWVMTDGPANSQASYKIFKSHKGMVTNEREVSFQGGHIEECSCYPNLGKVECVCRDNWNGMNRPVLTFDEDLNYEVGYLCAGIPTDTPRVQDNSFIGSCTNAVGGSGTNNYGVKGFGFRQGNSVWAGRTVSISSRSGFEILLVEDGWVKTSKNVVKKVEVLNNKNWSGYSGAFTIPITMTSKQCLVPCFWLEMIRGKPEERTSIWTSSSSTVFCGVSSEVPGWSWDDGAILPFDIDKM